MVSKSAEPGIHRPPRNGEGNEDGDQDQPHEIFGQHGNHVGYRSAQYFPDPYLFCAYLRVKGGKAEQAEAGDQYCQAGEAAGMDGDPLLRKILRLVGLIEETVLKIVTGIVFFVEGCQAG